MRPLTLSERTLTERGGGGSSETVRLPELYPPFSTGGFAVLLPSESFATVVPPSIIRWAAVDELKVHHPS